MYPFLQKPELSNSLKGIETETSFPRGAGQRTGRNSQIPWKGLKPGMGAGTFWDCYRPELSNSLKGIETFGTWPDGINSLQAGTLKFPERDWNLPQLLCLIPKAIIHAGTLKFPERDWNMISRGSKCGALSCAGTLKFPERDWNFLPAPAQLAKTYRRNSQIPWKGLKHKWSTSNKSPISLAGTLKFPERDWNTPETTVTPAPIQTPELSNSLKGIETTSASTASTPAQTPELSNSLKGIETCYLFGR